MTTAGGRPKLVYTDLDGTLLGQGGSIFRGADGQFTMAGARALELINGSGAKAVFVSGRSARLLREDARVLGVDRFIAEAGCLIVRDGEERNNCEPFGLVEGTSVFDEIAATGAPDLLLENYSGSLAYHDPWHADHEYTHLMRGCIDVGQANRLLAETGHADLKVVDNGVIEDRGYGMEVPSLHAYHLVPSRAGKGSAIAMDLELSGLGRGDAVACGDSDQDLEMAPAVRTLYLMSNALTNCSGLEEGIKSLGNVVVVEAPMVEGFLEAMLAELGA